MAGRHEVLVGHGEAVERQRGRHADDRHLLQRAGHAGHRGGAVLAPHDQLADHRVVGAADDVTGLHAAVETNPRVLRHRDAGDRAGGGHEACRRVLGVQPHLDGVAAQLDVVLDDGHAVARGDPQLLVHQVHAGDELRDRVLDLQTGVHLQEVVAFGAVGVAVDEELTRSGVDVAHLAGHADGCFAQGRTGGVGQAGCRGFLHQLLVATLQRAVALAQVDDGSVGVGKDLHLDVAGTLQVPLDVALATAEGRLGLAASTCQRRLDVAGAADDLHATTTAAERRLDGQGPAMGLAEGPDQLWVGRRLGRPGHDGHVGRTGNRTSGQLVAHGLDGLRGWADPGESGVDDGTDEVGVLRQEAVARVDGVHPCLLGDLEDPREVEVTLGGWGGAEEMGLVGHAHVHGAGVGLGVDGDASHAQLATGAGDPDGDLSTVGDQHCVEHEEPIVDLD